MPEPGSTSSKQPRATTRPTVTVGQPTTQPAVAGRDALPASSKARTVNVWGPGDSPDNSCGEEQVDSGPPSRLHRNDATGSVAWNSIVASGPLPPPDGALSITTPGPV